MAQSQLALYNMALSEVGERFTVAATSEQSIPAEVCTLWYENVRQVMLRAAHWNCAKRYARLTEEAERDLSAAWVSTDPEPGFAFSYDLPDSLLYARYLTNFSRFSLGYETDQKIISCNIGGDNTEDKPILCFTVDVTDPEIWDPDLYLAMVFALAGHICIPITGKVKKATDLMALANQRILEARAASANEMSSWFQQVPGELQARGFAYSNSLQSPYIYPYGPVFTGTGAPLI